MDEKPIEPIPYEINAEQKFCPADLLWSIAERVSRVRSIPIRRYGVMAAGNSPDEQDFTLFEYGEKKPEHETDIPGYHPEGLKRVAKAIPLWDPATKRRIRDEYQKATHSPEFNHETYMQGITYESLRLEVMDEEFHEIVDKVTIDDAVQSLLQG